jgi:hypothetical protein
VTSNDGGTPQVLDLYSGPGGVGVALDALCIDHAGVDIIDYSDTYPGKFVQGDASWVPFVARLPSPDLLWLSPPCQRWSQLSVANASRYDWPDGEIERRYPGFDDLNVRDVIDVLDPDHYIIENVPRCPELRDPVRLDGLAFGKPYRIRRHFETSFPAPDHVDNGRPGIGIGTNDAHGNTEYQRRELAEAKGIPTDWSEQATHSAIPREYVQYLLHYCPSTPEVPLPLGAPGQRLLTDGYGGTGHQGGDGQ